MSPFYRALVFYVRKTVGGRLRAFITRLRRPRHFIGLALVAVYLWLFLYQPWNDRIGERDPATIATWTNVWLPLFVVAQVVLSWIVAGLGRGGLPFRENEVRILFPAPIARHQLVLFKIVQAQFGILVFALFTGLLARRLGGLEFFPAFMGCWAAGFVIYLNGALAGLVLARIRVHSGLIVSILPGFLLLGVVVAAGYVTLGNLPTSALESPVSGETASSPGSGLEEIATTAPLSNVLTPARLLLAPIRASGVVDVVLALLPALGVAAALTIVLCLVPIPLADSALRIAATIERIKREGLSGARNKKAKTVKTSFRLAPSGPAWKAFYWKTFTSLGRANMKMFVFVITLMLAFGVVIGVVVPSLGDRGRFGGFFLLMILPYVPIFGVGMLRADLRMDLPHFDLLKGLPVRARDVMFGSVLATSTVLFCVEFVWVTLAVVLIGDDLGERGSLTIGDRVGYWVGGLGFLGGLTFVLFAAENVVALHFPTFSRLGRGMKQGFDQFGQQLLGALLRLLVMVGLVIPSAIVATLVGGLVYWITKHVAASAAVGGVVCGIALFLEGCLLVRSGERRYCAFDLGNEHVPS